MARIPSEYYVPCRWTGCRSVQRFKHLPAHISNAHSVVDGFGCEICGSRHPAESVIRNHLLEQHKLAIEPRRAPLALAHYYLIQFRKSDPALGLLPLKDFYYSSGEKHSLEPAESQANSYVHQDSCRTVRVERAVDSNESCCPECGVVIKPCTRARILHHLRQHHRVIVDLDYTRVASCGESGFTASLSNPIPNIEDPEAFDVDNQDDCGHYSEDEDIDGDGESDQNEGTREASNPAHDEYNELVSTQNIIEMHKAKPSSMSTCSDGSAQVRKGFMSCIQEASLGVIENAFSTHETREIRGETYRLNKALPPCSTLDSDDIIRATFVHGRWRCQVPQCGATFPHVFAIDVHLQAHGTITLSKWYCGDATCNIGGERIFQDRESFESHIATEHWGSSYSRAAGRRSPQRDAFIDSLTKQLKFEGPRTESRNCQDEFATLSTALVNQKMSYRPSHDTYPDLCAWARFCFDHVLEPPETGQTWKHCAWATFTKSEVLEEPMIEEVELLDNDQVCEILAWARFVHFCFPDNLKLIDEDDDLDFSEQHYQGFIKLLPPTQSDSEKQRMYLIQTLTGRMRMYEKDAAKFIVAYDELCDMARTKDQHILRRVLLFPNQVVADETELRTVGRRIEEVDGCQGDNLTGTRTLWCPWPDCQHSTGGHKYRIVNHFLSVHLNCLWQCPEKGCEYCCYHQPNRLERHRMSCHIGSPLQCGHSECQQTSVSDVSASRGHMNYASLRNHFEKCFNQKLQSSRAPSKLYLGSQNLSEVRQPEKPLPNDFDYERQYAGRSSWYLSKGSPQLSSETESS